MLLVLMVNVAKGLFFYNREMRRIVLRYLLVFFEHGLW